MGRPRPPELASHGQQASERVQFPVRRREHAAFVPDSTSLASVRGDLPTINGGEPVSLP